ncbi:hypothetical protein GCM10010417_27540 [Streptomyces carpaticus]
MSLRRAAVGPVRSGGAALGRAGAGVVRRARTSSRCVAAARGSAARRTRRLPPAAHSSGLEGCAGLTQAVARWHGMWAPGGRSGVTSGRYRARPWAGVYVGPGVDAVRCGGTDLGHPPHPAAATGAALRRCGGRAVARRRGGLRRRTGPERCARRRHGAARRRGARPPAARAGCLLRRTALAWKVVRL